MAEFDIVEAGFSNQDETINFGGRAVGDEKNLYEISTIAVIKSSEDDSCSSSSSESSLASGVGAPPPSVATAARFPQGPESVTIKACWHKKGKIYFTTNKHIRVMSDKQMTEEYASFELPQLIDEFAVYEPYFMVCTRGKQITIFDQNRIDANDSDPIIYRQRWIEGDEIVTRKYFIAAAAVERPNRGAIFFHCIYTGLIVKICMKGEKFVAEHIKDFRTNFNNCSFDLPYVLLENSTQLIIFNVQTRHQKVIPSVDFERMHFVGRVVIGLDRQGVLWGSSYEGSRLFTLDNTNNIPKNIIQTMFLPDEKTISNSQLALVTRESEPPRIELYSYPDLSKIFSVPYEHQIHFVQLDGPSEEILFFTEIRRGGIIKELRLQHITPADPNLRVQKLVEKGDFDAAEATASNFRVSPEFINKAKARYYVNKLLCSTKDVDQLLSLLDKVEDKLFALNSCDIVDCETGEDTRRVLSYGANLNFNYFERMDDNDKDTVLSMKEVCNRKLYRFDTYMQICSKYDHKSWNDFMDCKLIDEVMKLLTSGKIEEALLVYCRLDKEAYLQLNDYRIEDILNTLSQLNSANIYLKTFIPVTLKYKPDSLTIFVNWLIKKVYHMEYNRYMFPDGAIRTVDEVTNLLHLDASIKRHLNFNECINELTNLRKALTDIKMLLNNFGIMLNISDYLHTPDDVVKSILKSNLDSNELEQIIKDFISSYMLRNKLDMDTYLIQGIKNLFAFGEDYWTNIAMILLKFVSNLDKKLEAIVDILEVAALPWSNAIKDIAGLAFEYVKEKSMANEIVQILNDEKRIIILNKYDINRKQFVSISDKEFYINRIIYENLNKRNKPKCAIEDIRQLCTCEDDIKLANRIMLVQFIKRDKVEAAMEVLDSNPEDKMLELGELVLHFLAVFINGPGLNKNNVERYCCALKLTWKRLKDRIKDSIALANLERQYKINHTICQVLRFYDTILTAKDFADEKSKKIVLDQTLMKAVDKVLYLDTDSGDTNFLLLLEECKKVANCFHESIDNIFIWILDKLDALQENFEILYNLGNNVLMSSRSAMNLSVCAVYLFKYIKRFASDSVDETFSEVLATRSCTDEDHIKSIELAKKLVCKALVYCKKDEVSPIIEVLQWIDTCYHFLNPGNCPGNFRSYISSTTAYPFMLSLEVVKKTFIFYSAYVEPYKMHSDLKYITYFSVPTTFKEDDLKIELMSFTSNLQALLKDGQYLSAYYLVTTLLHGLFYDKSIKPEILNILKLFIMNEWLPQILDRVVSHKYIDYSLFYSLMLLYGKRFDKYLNAYLQTCKRRPLKLCVLSQVGLRLLQDHGIPEGQEDLKRFINLCNWWNKVKDAQINYDQFFSDSAFDRLEKLIVAKKVTLDNLLDYCKDFRLDSQQTYLKYLHWTLTYWKPDVEYVTDVSGRKNILIKNSETELGATCGKIIQYITNKDEVFKLTEEIWPTVNVYYYEVYLVLLSIQMKLRPKTKLANTAYRPLLAFLQRYKRVSAPSRSEIEQWYGAFPFEAFIDPLSEFRLPLSSTFLTSDIWVIIKPEVNLKTYQEWFKITGSLGQHLNKHDICTYAISNVLSTGLFDTSSTNWELQLLHEHLVYEVDDCAKNIVDLERAASAIYTLMCGMPPGADKVRMAELSYRYAEKYKESKPKNKDVEKTYVKVKQRYVNYSAMHILHKHELAKEEYLNLVGKPKELIFELYSDPRIVKQFEVVNFHCPDINKAVDELCELFGLGAKSVRYELISQLLKGNSGADLESTFVTHALLENDELSCIKRACYICSGPEVQVWRKNLLKIGFNKDNSESMVFKANALRCFYRITDFTTIEEMTEMNPEDFEILIDKTLVIAKLTDLRVNVIGVEDLDTNRRKIMKSLLKLKEPLAIKCLANICKIYKLDGIKYWQYIITSALNFGNSMIKDLYDYVEYLRYKYVTDFIIAAWNKIFQYEFLQAGLAEGGESERTEMRASYIKTLKLLQTCPVVHVLNYDSCIEMCISSKFFEIAAVLLLYIPEEKQKEYAKTIILFHKTVINNVEDLKEEGIVGISRVVRILHENL